MPTEPDMPLVPIDFTPPAPSSTEVFKEEQGLEALRLATRDLIMTLDPLDDAINYSKAHCLLQALNLF